MRCRFVGRLGVALLVWVAALPAFALTVTYDLSGVSTWQDTASGGFDPYAPLPPLVAGSYLTLDFDGSGGVSVTSSRFILHSETVSIETNLVASLSGGAGTLLPALLGIEFSIAPQFAIEGTVRCKAGSCAAFGVSGDTMSWDEWLDANGLEPVDPVAAASTWQFGLGDQLGTLPIARDPTYGFYTSMIFLRGTPVPEPASGALAFVALFALARRRFA